MNIRSMIMLCVGLTVTGCASPEPQARSYMTDAQNWVGTDAKIHRKELRNYMTAAKAGPVDPATVPWCAGWANAVLQSNGLIGTKSLAARSFLKWGVPTHEPKEGDIVVVRRGNLGWQGHVGFFVGYEEYEGQRYVKILGGNTDKRVDIGYFPTKIVWGYREPLQN
jgi:uncharacterized protein (TIGR02594 family)